MNDQMSDDIYGLIRDSGHRGMSVDDCIAYAHYAGFGWSEALIALAALIGSIEYRCERYYVMGMYIG